MFSSAISQPRIAVIGLGYVGLPLAIAFARAYEVIGFDIKAERIAALKAGRDHTGEVDLGALQEILRKESPGCGLALSSNMADLKSCTVFIVTVPTPINKFKAPDLGPLIWATEMIGRIIKKGDLVIYESTVYPGCTEEDCVPVLEKESGLVFNADFFVGYSPERIVPGDKVHTLTTIKKVTSGSTPEIAEQVDQLYKTIITAGTHKAPSIKVAEASKAIENAQRDVNISFVNELALIFDRLGIDTHDVLEAAATKFNFLNFRPGLVGGHCISVDPYYLAYKAQSLGYHPQVILSGRKINDEMPEFIASKVIKLMIARNLKIKRARVLLLGITFKENCPDIRNTRVVDVYHELKQYGVQVDIFDPYADRGEVRQSYQVDLLSALPQTEAYDVVVLAVAHSSFLEVDYKNIKKENGILFDIKSCLDPAVVDGRL